MLGCGNQWQVPAQWKGMAAHTHSAECFGQLQELGPLWAHAQLWGPLLSVRTSVIVGYHHGYVHTLQGRLVIESGWECAEASCRRPKW